MATNHSEPESTEKETTPKSDRSDKFVGGFGTGITLTPAPEPKANPKSEKKKQKD